MTNGPAEVTVWPGCTASVPPFRATPQAALSGPLTVKMPLTNSATPPPVKVVVPLKTKSPANCSWPPLTSKVPSVEVPPPANDSVPLCAETVPVLLSGAEI